MANEVWLKTGTPITVTIAAAMTGIATSTTSGGVQSTKVDLTTGRAQRMLVRLQATWGASPAAGTPLEVYVGFSSLSTAASGNPANLSGTAGAYSGYNNDLSTTKAQLQFVGILAGAATTSTQIADVGIFTPLDRYATLVVVNGGTWTLNTTSTNHAMTIIPLMDEVQ
jgi:hypothetical protein